MRGEILTYDDGPGAGLISGDDGQRYSFSRADLQQLTPVRPGMKVDFVPAEGVATQVIVVVGQPAIGTGYTPGVAGSGASIDWKTLFLEANGRIGQKDYWIGVGILFAAGLVLGWIPAIGTVVSLASIYFGICVSSKRLHDMGKSGWLAAIPYGVTALAVVLSAMTFIGGIVSTGYGNDFGALAGMGAAGGVWALAFLVNLGFLIWLGVTTGQPGDNLYGPPPRPLATF
ncbi:DUF805 domain-containing protein [Brevundimonas sp.]|uniref:DUF805 domain-containing protein n=1 Tax=Brevundimonas sp. TaxID=1871086 RepID=UPI003D0E0FD1